MITFVSPRKITQAFLIIGIASIIIFIINLFISKGDILTRKKRDYEIGEISKKTIVAPFNFFLYEDEELYKEKQKKAEDKVLDHYTILTNIKFETQKNINDFFNEIEKIDNQLLTDTNKVNELSKKGYELSLSSFRILKEKNNKNLIYNIILPQIIKFYDRGVIEEKPENKNIILVQNGNSKEISTEELFTPIEIKDKLLEDNASLTKNEEWVKLIDEIISNFIVENLVFDEGKTKQAKRIARNSVPKIIGEVLKDELIIQEHQKITEDIFKRLKTLENEKNKLNEEKAQKILPLIIQFIYIFITLSFFIIIFYYFHPKILQKISLFRICIIFSIFLSILIIIIQNLESLSDYILPFGLTIILLAFLIDARTAIIFGLINFFLLISFLNWKFFPSFIISFSGMSSVLALKNPKSRRDFYIATTYIVMFFILYSFLFGFLGNSSLIKTLIQIKWGIFGAVISLIGSMVLLAPLEQRLPVVTNIHLQELGDFGNIPLKTLSEVASGTYHHSIIVGNLAEVAAKSINANGLLAKVASYYHDIGKTKNPEHFIENIKEDNESIHNELTSTESAKLVKKHVEEGVKLAKENHIPKAIIDIIKQHHGNSQICYFYKQAQENNEEINKEDFYYDGPKPQTKEAAIVMIADIIESSTKALQEPTVDEIKSTVNKSIKRLIESEQLSESNISLKELKTLQKSIMPILLGIYKKRIVYPE